MADAPLLPFDYKDFYKVVNEYTSQLIALANDMRESTALETQLLTDSIYTLAADTAKHLQLQQPKAAVPYFDFAPLQNAVAALQKTTDSLHEALMKMDKSAASDALNKALYQAEQQLLLPQGLPRRPWYKHAIYAPGFYTGYGVKTLPGIREAIEQRNWTEAQAQIQLAADAINRFNKYLQQIHG